MAPVFCTIKSKHGDFYEAVEVYTRSEGSARKLQGDRRPFLLPAGHLEFRSVCGQHLVAQLLILIKSSDIVLYAYVIPIDWEMIFDCHFLIFIRSFRLSLIDMRNAVFVFLINLNFF